MHFTIRSLYCHRISSTEVLGLGLSTLVHQGHHLLDPSADLHPLNKWQNPQPSHWNYSFSGFSLSNNNLIKSQINIPKMAMLQFLQKILMKEINNLILLNIGIPCVHVVNFLNISKINYLLIISNYHYQKYQKTYLKLA